MMEKWEIHNRSQIGPIISGIIMCLFIRVPPIFSQQEPKLFNLSEFSGALLFQYEFTSEEESIYEQVYRDINRNYLEGGIRLDVLGSIYHQNLLSFKAIVNILGHRSKNILFSDASINNAVNSNYNINLNFLKKKKLNFHFYAVRTFSTFDRAFYERLFSTYKSFGARVVSKAKLFPFQLDVYTLRSKTDSLLFSERDERTTNLDLRMDLLQSKRTVSRLTLRGKDYSEYVFDINYKSWDLLTTFQHNYGKGGKTWNTLSSVFSVHRITGTGNFETYNLYNSVVHYLKDTLFFQGNYTYLKDNSLNRSFTKQSFLSSLNHKLYESLNSRLLIGGRFEDSNVQKLNAFQYGYSFNYRKKIPKGVLNVFYFGQREKGIYRSKGGLVSTGEIFDFSLADSIILTQPGIAIDSIRVTDENLTYIYIRGVDYQVNVVGDVITITRLPGGAILAESTVLVHFDYLAFPDFNLDRKYYQFVTQLNVLKLFRIYYKRYVNDQDIISDYTIPPFESYRKNIVGAQFNFRFLKGDYYRERHDSVLSDYISRNYRLSAMVELSRLIRLSGDLTINRLNYLTEVYFSRMDAYSGEIHLSPFNNLTLNAIYRNIKYAIPGTARTRKSIVVKFQWAIRRIIVEFFYEHIFRGYEDIERSHDYGSLVIRRTF